MSKSLFTYVTYIRTTPEKVWAALTSPEFIRQYWFDMRVECDWKTGSSWKLSFPDGRRGDDGEIVEAVPPRRLVIKWHNQWMPELQAEGASLCTFTLEPVPDHAKPVVKLSVVHSMERDKSKFIDAVSNGWPSILSNLKSLLETGAVVMPTKTLPKSA